VKGLHGTNWHCGEARSPQHRHGAATPTAPTAPALLAPFSTSLPLGLVKRLRVSARKLGLCEREIATEAIERLPGKEGF
jgi:hypothetical protein